MNYILYCSLFLIPFKKEWRFCICVLHLPLKISYFVKYCGWHEEKTLHVRNRLKFYLLKKKNRFIGKLCGSVEAFLLREKMRLISAWLTFTLLFKGNGKRFGSAHNRVCKIKCLECTSALSVRVPKCLKCPSALRVHECPSSARVHQCPSDLQVP